MARCRGDGYPFDFDASLRITRLPDGVTLHPHPQIIGHMNVELPLFDAKQILPAAASSGWGPMVGVIETNNSPMFIDQTAYTLPKVEG